MAMATETVVAVPVVAEVAVKNPETPKKNRIQVSNTKKPLFFYVNLAKRYMQQHNEVELSALGMAITTVVTIAEILKNNGLATEKKVLTSTVGTKDETKGRLIQKARIEIVLLKTEKFDSLMAAPTAAPEENKDEKQTAAAPEAAAENKDEKQTTAAENKDEKQTAAALEAAAENKDEKQTTAAENKDEKQTAAAPEAASENKDEKQTAAA